MFYPPMGGLRGPKSIADIMFDKFDIDKNGSIDHEEFHHMCFNLGHALSNEEVEYACKVLDKDGNGAIERNEFKTWWKDPNRWEKLALSPEELKLRKEAAEIFCKFDKDGNGVLSTKEFDDFHKFLKKTGLTKKDKKTCLTELDSNLDGQVQYSEYVEWLVMQKSIHVRVIHK